MDQQREQVLTREWWNAPGTTSISGREGVDPQGGRHFRHFILGVQSIMSSDHTNYHERKSLKENPSFGKHPYC